MACKIHMPISSFVLVDSCFMFYDAVIAAWQQGYQMGDKKTAAGNHSKLRASPSSGRTAFVWSHCWVHGTLVEGHERE